MKRITAYVLALVLTCSCAFSVAGAYYADVPGSSALAGEVEKAVRYGLMNGYSQAQFGYSDTMTRAQFLVVLTRMLGWQTPSTEEADAGAGLGRCRITIASSMNSTHKITLPGRKPHRAAAQPKTIAPSAKDSDPPARVAP